MRTRTHPATFVVSAFVLVTASCADKHEPSSPAAPPSSSLSVSDETVFLREVRHSLPAHSTAAVRHTYDIYRRTVRLDLIETDRPDDVWKEIEKGRFNITRIRRQVAAGERAVAPLREHAATMSEDELAASLLLTSNPDLQNLQGVRYTIYHEGNRLVTAELFRRRDLGAVALETLGKPGELIFTGRAGSSITVARLARSIRAGGWVDL